MHLCACSRAEEAEAEAEARSSVCHARVLLQEGAPGRLARIGAGSFAAVFVWPGRSCVALKVVKDDSRSAALVKEFGVLQAARACVSNVGLLFLLPAPLRFYPSVALFQRDMALQPHTTPPGLDPCAPLYAMERVWPLPHCLSLLVRQRYFPPAHAACDEGFIARIYLGRSASRLPLPASRRSALRCFSPNNWPLDACALEDLGLPVPRIAHDMGRLLARFHFVARCDARDVEFVVGGDPLDPLEKPAFFCIDFDQVQALHDDDEAFSVGNLVDSFFDNDPYYPRPSSKYWHAFRTGYLAEATGAPDHHKAEVLAREVLQAIEVRAAAAPAPCAGSAA